jgi:hypothetical protein
MSVGCVRRIACVLLALAFATVSPGFAADAARTPVVVELFTSEGCSDCPPADTLLRELETAQPIAGVQVIPLAFHVDYWDHQGWRDRFSSSAFTRRQNEYGERFRLESVYTPQVVVNGLAEMVGNDRASVRRALTQAARSKLVQPKLERAANGAITVDVSDAGGADVLLAITEANLASDVRDGENRGRQLRHTGVVRWMKLLGTTKAGAFHGSITPPIAGDWKRADLRAIVLVQRHGQGEIVGAASVPLN